MIIDSTGKPGIWGDVLDEVVEATADEEVVICVGVVAGKKSRPLGL
jgi:hypothetical protein